MDNTEHYNFKLPGAGDAADIEDINDNMEELDDILYAIRQVPAVTSSDNGKFLRVVEGEWVAVAMTNASGGNF